MRIYCGDFREPSDERARFFFLFLVFFRAFVGLSFASSFPGGGLQPKKSSSSGGKFSLLSFLSLRVVATH